MKFVKEISDIIKKYWKMWKWCIREKKSSIFT